MLGEVGRIDIYRVDCVNVGAQKGPIDFRRCVNGNTIEGRDRGSCGQVEDLGHAYCGQPRLHSPACRAFMTRNRTLDWGRKKQNQAIWIDKKFSFYGLAGGAIDTHHKHI